MIKAVLFDMIGTTVMENDPSMISNCFLDAFKDHDLVIEKHQVSAIRGMDKREAITRILKEAKRSESFGNEILFSFQKRVNDQLHNFSENAGFSDAVRYLRSKGTLVGIGTGLSTPLFNAIFSYLQWDKYHFDFIGIADEIGKGRPHPDMLMKMMTQFSVSSFEFVKVGDTIADIEEGKNAGVKTVAILSGTQPENQLRSANPDHVIRSLTELENLIEAGF